VWLLMAMGAVTGLIAAPHALPLHRVAPLAAAMAWLSALALRALIAVGGALLLLVFLPGTDPFQKIAQACLHLHLSAVDLGLHGHAFAHVAAAAPTLWLAASVVWVTFWTARAAAAVRALIAARTAGHGPRGSTIVEGDEVLVAATMLGRRQLIVSRGALKALEPDELDASLCHELAHLRRRHRALVMLGAAFVAVARPLPGTLAAKRELAFSIERDADEYAVRETRDPLALASAICKSARSATGAPLLGLHGRGRARLRLEYLLEGGRPRPGTWLEGSARALATLLAAAALSLAATLPSLALAAPGEEAGAHAEHRCPD
jgi:Zn-dependent protease with chaperone function